VNSTSHVCGILFLQVVYSAYLFTYVSVKLFDLHENNVVLGCTTLAHYRHCRCAIQMHFDSDSDSDNILVILITGIRRYFLCPIKFKPEETRLRYEAAGIFLEMSL